MTLLPSRKSCNCPGRQRFHAGGDGQLPLPGQLAGDHRLDHRAQPVQLEPRSQRVCTLVAETVGKCATGALAVALTVKTDSDALIRNDFSALAKSLTELTVGRALPGLTCSP
ncbi:MAG: hypothetical protein ACR2M5_14705 [Nakamurella sp.]